MPTFVLRLQAPGPPPTAGEPLRGVVDEVATGVSSTFACAAELVAVLSAALRAAGERGAGRPRPDPR